MLPPADINEIAPGLWRWTAKHPEWVAGAKPGSAQEWPREVASVVYEAPGGLVVIDPLVPEGGEGLWAWLDERVAAAGGRVWALTTIKWHRRSRDAVAERYGASRSRAKGSLPEGVEPVRVQGCRRDDVLAVRATSPRLRRRAAGRRRGRAADVPGVVACLPRRPNHAP